MDYEKIINLFFGFASAVAKYLRAIGAIDDAKLEKFGDIFGKITKNAGEMKEDLENV